MLPPVDSTVLEKNPKFASLYAILSTDILKPNGASKYCHGEKEDLAINALKASRTKASKLYLLKSSISKLDLSSSVLISDTARPAPPLKQLPHDLIEVIILLSHRLSDTQPSPSSYATSILENTPQWMSVTSFLPRIGSLLSSYFHTQALTICRLLNPSTNPSQAHHLIPNLVPTIIARQIEIEEKKHKIDLRRLELVEKAKMLISLYHLASTLVILHLEQTVHGSISREVKAKTEFLSMVAKKLALETREKRLRGNKIFYSAPVKCAFNEYMRLIQNAREHLEERRLNAKKSLLGYGIGGSKPDEARIMRSISDKYGELKKHINEVRRDVEKLRGI